MFLWVSQKCPDSCWATAQTESYHHGLEKFDAASIIKPNYMDFLHLRLNRYIINHSTTIEPKLEAKQQSVLQCQETPCQLQPMVSMLSTQGTLALLNYHFLGHEPNWNVLLYWFDQVIVHQPSDSRMRPFNIEWNVGNSNFQF